MRQSTNAALIVFMAFSGLTLAYSVRIILSPAILRMKILYEWDESIQGLLFSAFYWGYMILQVPGGYLSHHFGAKWVMVLGLLGSALVNTLVPLCGSSIPLAFLCRFLSGTLQGMYWVSCLNIISKWVEKSQVSFAVSMALTGQHFGSALIQGAYSPLAEAVSWTFPFYLLSALSIGWTFMWWFLVESYPPPAATKQNAAGAKEESRKHVNDISFSQILKSRPVWAFVAVLFCYNWSFYFLVSYLIKFLNLHLKFTADTSGLFSLAAYLLLCVTLSSGGKLTSMLISRQFDPTKVRRGGVFVGLFPSMLCIFAAALLYDHFSASAIAYMLIFSISVSGFAHGAFMTNPVDLDPRAPGVIGGLGNTVATVPGIVVPIINGAILNSGNCSVEPESRECWLAWRLLFLISGVIYAIGLAVWLSFSSGHELIPDNRKQVSIDPL